MKSRIMQSLKGNKKGDRLGVSLQELDICTHSIIQIGVCEYTYSSATCHSQEQAGCLFHKKELNVIVGRCS